MKILFLSCLLILLIFSGCEKSKDSLKIQYEARIVGFDPNCETCIVSFAEDLSKVKVIAGESPDNYYQVVNLQKGDFTVGQKLKVEIRKAEERELPVCKTLDASQAYKNLYLLDSRNYGDLVLNDTIELSYKDCINDRDRQCYICLDSVISDSRCPKGAECIWAGEATARFKIEKYNAEPVYINIKEGEKGVVFNNYRITFIKLLPYPALGHNTKPEDYKARIVIQNI